MNEKISEVKQSFETQLKEAEQKITTLKSELEKLEEYKIKLQGGLETIEILSQEEKSEEE